MNLFTLKAIGTVYNERKTPEDDYWGNISSLIELGEEWDESCLDGIEAFSHAEIHYIFHLVLDENIQNAARHPRNNPAYPKVGIFAQRGKNRPNKMGSTIAEVIKREGRSLWVRGLDAIDGTPIIDIKPVMKEFLPRGEIRQPKWSCELMKNYWE
ncbi:tRNA-Thr(GGU) m(6)t(6)A37 methyltransferase TsaA [Bacillus sp. OV322]|uniref:SAM-dependent methyltransferase n=1 Tax=Bacillus sp. OV322 TaxID=1882764 RepID=UPI0008EEA9E8|nr:SAM-dependent methyltransferase [Bacillus sp. OV322]SFC51679.1 tRNA-Thr(GGU) m(6)t(6)A37 methyltransferase TsaA [Bacillus sp. OV322]